MSQVKDRISAATNGKYAKVLSVKYRCLICRHDVSVAQAWQSISETNQIALEEVRQMLEMDTTQFDPYLNGIVTPQKKTQVRVVLALEAGLLLMNCGKSLQVDCHCKYCLPDALRRRGLI